MICQKDSRRLCTAQLQRNVPYVYVYIYIYECVGKHIYIYMCVCVCVNVCKYINMHYSLLHIIRVEEKR